MQIDLQIYSKGLVLQSWRGCRKETFVVFCAIKPHDSRLTKRNKLPHCEFEGAKTKQQYVYECAELDNIHSAHVDQIIEYIK